MDVSVPQPSATPPSVTPSGTKVMDGVASDAVGRKTRSGVVWSGLQVVGRNVISLGTTALLARFISPGDYGLMGMVSTMTALLLAFSDMGLSWATVQRRDLTEGQVSNLLWINSLSGLALWGVCWLAAPWLASFYQRPELATAATAVGAGFFLTGLGAQPMALLTRRMQFDRASAVELGSSLAGAVTGVVLALLGFGWWALIWQSLATQAVRTLLAFAAARPPMMMPRRGEGTSNLVRFGGQLALNGLMIYFARNLDNVVIGKVWGTEQLGYYGRAYFLMLLPSMLANGVLTNLMVPSLAAFRDDPARLEGAYGRATRLIAFAGCPMSLGLALTGTDAVHLVYGEAWAPVVPMLLWLSIAGVTQPIYNTNGWLFIASGQGTRYLLLTVGNATALTATFLLSVSSGPVAVAAGYGIVMGLVLLWPALQIAHAAAGISLARTAKIVAPVGLCLLAMAGAVLAMHAGAQWMGLPWQLRLGLDVITGALVYTLTSLLALREMWVRDILPMLPARAAQGIAIRLGLTPGAQA